MAYLLTAFGHETLQATDGTEGIRAAQQEKPDLILLDIHMPRMDGYEVVSRFRNDPRCSDIPVVAVTALAMVGDREKILNAGFTGYIAKPLDPRAFPSQVNGFLERSLQTHALPRCFPETAAAATTPRRKLAAVLLVDNVQTNIDLVRSILELSGYEALAVRSVEEALKVLRQKHPDLILSDVHMPRQNGFDLLRILQEDTELSKIPFVFLSSSVLSLQEREKALVLGARKFISRPIEPQALLSEIEDCLQQGREI